jgi:hypothetical protein
MLSIIQRFGKHCSFHFQGEYVVAGRIWQPYIGQAVGDEFDLMVLIGGAEEFFLPASIKLRTKRESSYIRTSYVVVHTDPSENFSAPVQT